MSQNWGINKNPRFSKQYSHFWRLLKSQTFEIITLMCIYTYILIYIILKKTITTYSCPLPKVQPHWLTGSPPKKKSSAHLPTNHEETSSFLGPGVGNLGFFQWIERGFPKMEGMMNIDEWCLFLFKHVGLNNRNSSNTIGFFQQKSWIMLKVKDVLKKDQLWKKHIWYFLKTNLEHICSFFVGMTWKLCVLSCFPVPRLIHENVLFSLYKSILLQQWLHKKGMTPQLAWWLAMDE